MRWCLLTRHQPEERGPTWQHPQVWARYERPSCFSQGQALHRAALECPNSRSDNTNHSHASYHPCLRFIESLLFGTSSVWERRSTPFLVPTAPEPPSFILDLTSHGNPSLLSHIRRKRCPPSDHLLSQPRVLFYMNSADYCLKTSCMFLCVFIVISPD